MKEDDKTIFIEKNLLSTDRNRPKHKRHYEELYTKEYLDTVLENTVGNPVLVGTNLNFTQVDGDIVTIDLSNLGGGELVKIAPITNILKTNETQELLLKGTNLDLITSLEITDTDDIDINNDIDVIDDNHIIVTLTTNNVIGLKDVTVNGVVYSDLIETTLNGNNPYNLLTGATYQTGKYLGNNDVVTTYAPFKYTTNYIEIKPNTTYLKYSSASFSGSFYDASNAYIGKITGADGNFEMEFKTPINCHYVRFNVLVSETSPYVREKFIEDVTFVKTKKAEINYLEKTNLFQIDNFDFSSYSINGNILIIGDSTIASYAGAVSIASLLYQTGTKTDISVPGHTIAQQLADYNALSSIIKTNVNYAFVQIGLNDLIHTESAEIALIRYQNLINQIKTDSPNAIIVCGVMIPCRERFIDLYGLVNGETSYQKLLSMNDAIMGNGDNKIVDVDLRTDVHYFYLADKFGNLKSEYDTGDHIHPNSKSKKNNGL